MQPDAVICAGVQKSPSLKKVSHPRYEWRVRWREGGKDRQRFFAAGQKQAARAFAQAKGIELGNHGSKHGTISDSERAAIVAFRDAVAGMPEPRPTLRDCVNAFLAGIANQLTPVTVSVLVEKRIAAAQSKGVHPRTLRDLGGTDGNGGRLGAFAAVFGDRQAAQITAEEIEQWVAGQCATDANRREMLVRLNGLFAYGVKRGFLRENPVRRLELPRPNAPRAHILTVKEARALLAHCSEAILPAVAVQLFGGLRRAEAERLDWHHIDFDSGTLKATQHKGAGGRRERSRFVPMLPALRAWLEPFRRLSGPVFPVAATGPRKGCLSPQLYRVGFVKAREAAGIAVWDENTLRHTYGSYRVASINDLERVRVEMGHSSSRTTTEHYVNAVRAKDAAEFWAILPDPAAPESIPLAILAETKSA